MPFAGAPDADAYEEPLQRALEPRRHCSVRDGCHSSRHISPFEFVTQDRGSNLKHADNVKPIVRRRDLDPAGKLAAADVLEVPKRLCGLLGRAAISLVSEGEAFRSARRANDCGLRVGLFTLAASSNADRLSSKPVSTAASCASGDSDAV